jgi:phage shock protein PspC (stress-responsive transcriptional regulator)
MNGFFAAIRRMGVTRSQDRWVGGVAGGLAARFGVDPLLARGVIGVSMLMGFGLVLYGIAWALLPEQSDGRIHLEETIRGRFDIALLGAIALVVLGMSSGDWWFRWGPFGVEWVRGLAWVAVVVAGVVIVINALRGKDRRPSGPAVPTWQPPYPEGQRPMTSPSTPVPPAPAPPGAPAAASGPFDPSVTSAAPWASAPAPATPRQPYGGHHGGYPTGHGAPVPPPPGRGWTPPPPTPPVPPQPPKPPRRGPGAALTGVVVAVILIGLAALLAADRAGVYDGPVAAVVVGGGVLLVGLGIIVSGLRGRTAGGLTALAIVGMVVAGPAVVFQDGDHWRGERGPVRTIDVAPTSRAAAEAGYSFGVGDADIDLTGIPLTGETLVVPISGGLGDVTVTVPEGAAVSADVTSGAGNIEWRVDGERERSDGVGHDRRFTSEAMADGSDAQIALQIEVGVGSITIEED